MSRFRRLAANTGSKLKVVQGYQVRAFETTKADVGGCLVGSERFAALPTYVRVHASRVGGVFDVSPSELVRDARATLYQAALLLPEQQVLDIRANVDGTHAFCRSIGHQGTGLLHHSDVPSFRSCAANCLTKKPAAYRSVHVDPGALNVLQHLLTFFFIILLLREILPPPVE